MTADKSESMGEGDRDKAKERQRRRRRQRERERERANKNTAKEDGRGFTEPKLDLAPICPTGHGIKWPACNTSIGTRVPQVYFYSSFHDASETVINQLVRPRLCQTGEVALCWSRTFRRSTND